LFRIGRFPSTEYRRKEIVKSMSSIDIGESLGLRRHHKMLGSARSGARLTNPSCSSQVQADESKNLALPNTLSHMFPCELRATVTAHKGKPIWDEIAGASRKRLALCIIDHGFAAFFLYGPRFFGAGSAASTSATRSSTSHNRSVTPAAIAGVMRSVLWVRQKL